MNDNTASSPGQLAWQAFERDLPRLYAERPEQWVAYRGDQIVAFGTKRYQLYQECLTRGLREDEIFIFGIAPTDLIVDLNPREVG